MILKSSINIEEEFSADKYLQPLKMLRNINVTQDLEAVQVNTILPSTSPENNVKKMCLGLQFK